MMCSITSVKEVLFSPVFICWLVGLWAGLHKNHRVDLYETWIEDVSWSRIDPINFWGGLWNFFSLALTL